MLTVSDSTDVRPCPVFQSLMPPEAGRRATRCLIAQIRSGSVRAGRCVMSTLILKLDKADSRSII